MIKSVLLGALLFAGFGPGIANAQERTVSVWGHDLTVQDTSQPRSGFVALAPEAMRDRIVASHRAHRSSHDIAR